MHAVQLRDEAVRAAERLGYQVREDWFDGRGGGVCLVRGRKQLFLDLAQSADEQLSAVIEAINRDPAAAHVEVTDELRARLAARG